MLSKNYIQRGTELRMLYTHQCGLIKLKGKDNQARYYALPKIQDTIYKIQETLFQVRP